VVLVVERQRGRKAGTWAPPKTKAGDRRVPIGLLASRALWRHLSTYREGIRGHVFSTPRRTEVSRSTASDLWRAAVEGMGLGDRSGWHDLRHFHASLLIADGRSVPAVAKRLGHKDQAETLATYSHLWPPDEDRSEAAVDAALSDL
jgi:integrase